MSHNRKIAQEVFQKMCEAPFNEKCAILEKALLDAENRGKLEAQATHNRANAFQTYPPIKGFRHLTVEEPRPGMQGGC